MISCFSDITWCHVLSLVCSFNNFWGYDLYIISMEYYPLELERAPGPEGRRCECYLNNLTFQVTVAPITNFLCRFSPMEGLKLPVMYLLPLEPDKASMIHLLPAQQLPKDTLQMNWPTLICPYQIQVSDIESSNQSLHCFYPIRANSWYTN